MAAAEMQQLYFFMSKKIDLTGKTFGRLTVLRQEGLTSDFRALWLCQCKCGNTITVHGKNLRNGNTNSCSCYRKEQLLQANLIHGQSAILNTTSEYKIWCSIKNRCFNSNEKAFKNYGGRGIIMCDRWKNSFENFLDDMGSKPSTNHTVERIDNNKNYEPSNCKWATRKEQSSNKRNNHIIEHDGRKMILADWARLLKVNEATIRQQLKKRTFEEIYNKYKPPEK